MRRSWARWRPGLEPRERLLRITRAEAPTEADTRRPAVRAGQESGEAGGERSERELVRPTARPRPDPDISIRAVKLLLVVLIQD